MEQAQIREVAVLTLDHPLRGGGNAFGWGWMAKRGFSHEECAVPDPPFAVAECRSMIPLA
jgi:hypothetical protein